MTDDAAVANEGDKNKRSSKKANSSTNHFKWTEDRRFELAKVVKSKLAHKVTDTNMDIKWKMVETAIKKRDLFDDYEGDLHGLKGKFNRDQKEICDRFGFTIFSIFVIVRLIESEIFDLILSPFLSKYHSMIGKCGDYKVFLDLVVGLHR